MLGFGWVKVRLCGCISVTGSIDRLAAGHERAARASNGILALMYSYRHSRSCLCAECLRADERSADRALDASVARLSASLSTPEPKPEVTSVGDLRRAIGKAPWEMSAPQFEAAAALRVVPAWTPAEKRLERLRQPPAQRALGLKRSYLRDGMELRLDVEWAPPGGYVVLVAQDEEASLNDPRRSFIKAAMDRGIAIAPDILAAYPDLSNPSAN